MCLSLLYVIALVCLFIRGTFATAISARFKLKKAGMNELSAWVILHYQQTKK